MTQKVADALEKIARELHGAMTPAERATMAEAVAALRITRRPGKKKPGG